LFSELPRTPSTPAGVGQRSYDWVRINIGELQYVESEGNYLTFQEVGRKTLTRMTIGKAQVPLASGYRDEQVERVK